MKDIVLKHRPDDMHVHLRDGEQLRAVAPYTAEHFGRALVMPNLSKPVLDGGDVAAYMTKIHEATRGHDFQPLMTVKLLPSTTGAVLESALRAGAVAAKFYPEGVTTNSDDGARSITELYPALAAMQDLNLVLCLHGETPGVFCMDRENHFLQDLERAALDFPRLRMVLEHVTTRDAVDVVEFLPKNVAATITPHHLEITLDDVVGDKLRPHLFCKPIAKRPTDRAALIRAATSGSSKFFLGTDSAPHKVGSKECSSGCAGVFCAPTALSVLAQVFTDAGASENLEKFACKNGADFYDLQYNRGEVHIRRESWIVPNFYGDVVPYRAGETLAWRPY